MLKTFFASLFLLSFTALSQELLPLPITELTIRYKGKVYKDLKVTVTGYDKTANKTKLQILQTKKIIVINLKDIALKSRPEVEKNWLKYQEYAKQAELRANKKKELEALLKQQEQLALKSPIHTGVWYMNKDKSWGIKLNEDFTAEQKGMKYKEFTGTWKYIKSKAIVFNNNFGLTHSSSSPLKLSQRMFCTKVIAGLISPNNGSPMRSDEFRENCPLALGGLTTPYPKEELQLKKKYALRRSGKVMWFFILEDGKNLTLFYGDNGKKKIPYESLKAGQETYAIKFTYKDFIANLNINDFNGTLETKSGKILGGIDVRDLNLK